LPHRSEVELFNEISNAPMLFPMKRTNAPIYEIEIIHMVYITSITILKNVTLQGINQILVNRKLLRI
jgi:hypothetical protein